MLYQIVSTLAYDTTDGASYAGIKNTIEVIYIYIYIYKMGMSILVAPLNIETAPFYNYMNTQCGRKMVSPYLENILNVKRPHIAKNIK